MGIFLPSQLEFLAGNDPKNLRPLGTIKPASGEKQPGPLKETLTLKGIQQSARYLEVRASNLGKIPAGHPAAGQKAWLFVDEIIVRTAP